MMQKRVWAVLLAVVLVFGAMTTATLGAETISEESETAEDDTEKEDVSDTNLEGAEEVIKSGSCGDDVTYSLTADGVLHIEGRGEMTNNPEWDFSGEDVFKVVIGEGVTAVGRSEFKNFVNMEEISLPSSLKSIRECALGNCPRLKELVIPDGVKEINQYMLFDEQRDVLYRTASDKALSRIVLGKSVETIGEGAFKGHNIKTIELNEGLKKIERGAFYECPDLSEVVIPDSVESIGMIAFSNCKSLVDVQFGEESRLREIGTSAFSGSKKLQSLYIPKSVVNIGWTLLSQCTDLYEILIPEGITELKGMCGSCTGLTKIALPSTVSGLDIKVSTSIDIEFSNCPSIKEIYYGGNRDEWEAAGGTKNQYFEDATVYYMCDGFNNAALTVSFDSQGGTEVPPITGVMYESKVTLPEAPARDNYKFAGWYTMTGGRGKAFTKDSLVTDNMTLYAYWVSGSGPTPEPSGGEDIVVGDPIVLVVSEKADISGIFSKTRLPDNYFVAPKGLASVNKRGMLSASKVGTVAVIATSGSDVLGIQKFVIQKPVMTKQITMSVGQSIEANTLLSGTTLGAVYSSSKPTVARVDEDGNIIAVAKGTAKITATIHGKTYKTTVKVKAN